MEDTHTEDKDIDIGRVGYGAALVGAIGLVAAWAMIANPSSREAMMQSYLWAFIVFMGLTLGCLTFTTLHHTVRGKWSSPLIRIWEAGGSWVSFLVMGLMFLPILVSVGRGSPILYRWLTPGLTDPHNPIYDPVIAHRWGWMNPTAFCVRFVILLICWAGLSEFLRRSNARQEKSGDENESLMRSSVGAVGMIFMVLSVTCAFTDWGMSLDPHWNSSMYGAWYVVGQGLFALAFAVFIATRFANRKPYSDVIYPASCLDLGNMLLATTIFWTYLGFTQFLIIWSGNIPEYTQFYMTRARDQFGLIGLAVIPLQFFIPFMVLLSPRVKTTPRLLSNIAIWIMCARIIDNYWVVMPAFPNRSGPAPVFSDLIAIVAFAGIWFGAFGLRVRKANLMPSFDHRLREAAHSHA